MALSVERGVAQLKKLMMVGVALLLVACTGSAATDNEGGGPYPQQLPGESYPGARQDITGTVIRAQNGCDYIQLGPARRFVIWPAGTASDGNAIVTAAGVRFIDGSIITGQGTVLQVSQLAGVPDGFWGSVLTFCDPGAQVVVVLDSVTVVQP